MLESHRRDTKLVKELNFDLNIDSAPADFLAVEPILDISARLVWFDATVPVLVAGWQDKHYRFEQVMSFGSADAL